MFWQGGPEAISKLAFSQERGWPISRIDCRGAARGAAADRRGASCCAPTRIAVHADRGKYFGAPTRDFLMARLEIATPPARLEGTNTGFHPLPDGVNGCPRRRLATTEEEGPRCQGGPRAPGIDPVMSGDPAGDQPTHASQKVFSEIGRSMHPQCVGARGLIERRQSWQSTPVPLGVPTG